MFDLDHWREIFEALGSNKLRTALTAFGVFWGIFMLVVMLASGTGLENGVAGDFKNGATNSFFMWTQRTSKPYRGLPANRSFEMTNEDVRAIREKVPEVGIVSPRNQLGGYRGSHNVSRGTKAGAFSVMGDYPQIRTIQAVPVDRGRFLNHLDLEQKRKVAVIGTRVVDVLFEPGQDPIGEYIQIQGVYFKVIGTFKPTADGNSESESQTIYIPFTTFQHAFNYGNMVGWLAVTSAEGVSATVTEQKVRDLLGERHRVAPDDDRAFGSFNLEERFLQIQGLFRGIRLLVWIVGTGTLAAGVIGVSNIMLVIVRERTREIGVRRALGATPMNVTLQIILEALLLTSVAGYAGLVAGVGLTEAVASWVGGLESSMFADPEIRLAGALQALGILVVAGTLAGLIPARRAVRVPPVQALRAD